MPKRTRIDIFWVLFGVTLNILPIYEIVHHQNMYYDSWRGGWVSNFALLPGGVFFLLYGFVGLIRRGGIRMVIDSSKWSIRATVLVVLGVPAIAVAYTLHSMTWLFVVPFLIIALAAVLAAIPPWRKRSVTPDRFADELERHLMGTEGKWDWDDTTSLALADDRLERIRWGLFKYDSLASQEEKNELKALIEGLRRGNLSGIDVPKYLTYH